MLKFRTRDHKIEVYNISDTYRQTDIFQKQCNRGHRILKFLRSYLKKVEKFPDSKTFSRNLQILSY